MKKISILLMGAFLLFGGVAFAGYTEPTYLEARKANNTAYNQKEAYREIQLVRFANRRDIAAPLASGDAVIWDIISADGVTIRNSTATQSADGSFAGILCTAILTNDGAGNTIGASTTFADDAGRVNWGYMVIHGPTFANVTAGGTNGNVWGDPMIISRDSGKVTTFESQGTDTNGINRLTKTAGNTGGFFLVSADTSSTAVKVFVETM